MSSSNSTLQFYEIQLNCRALLLAATTTLTLTPTLPEFERRFAFPCSEEGETDCSRRSSRLRHRLCPFLLSSLSCRVLLDNAFVEFVGHSLISFLSSCSGLDSLLFFFFSSCASRSALALISSFYFFIERLVGRLFVAPCRWSSFRSAQLDSNVISRLGMSFPAHPYHNLMEPELRWSAQLGI